MDHTKILFAYDSDVQEQVELESLWASPVPEGFKIDNIPFYAREIALNDIVYAEMDGGGMLCYKKLIQSSGHSTVRLWFAKDHEKDIPTIRQALRDLGCESEQSDLPRLVAVDVPPSVSYASIRTMLDDQEKLGMLEYEEACLGFL